MRPFDYVSVLLSIVISLALAHVLTGIGRMIESGVRRFSIPLAHWIGFCLFLCVDYWFSIWHVHEELVWTLGYVSLLLTQAALVYVASRLIVPATFSDRPIDLTAFFDRNRRKFMSIVIIYAIVNEATNLTLPGFGSLLLGLMVVAYIVLFSIAWIWKSQTVQLVVAAANVALTAYYAAKFVPAL
jgi:hypothetical protein